MRLSERFLTESFINKIYMISNVKLKRCSQNYVDRLADDLNFETAVWHLFLDYLTLIMLHMETKCGRLASEKRNQLFLCEKTDIVEKRVTLVISAALGWSHCHQ